MNNLFNYFDSEEKLLKTKLEKKEEFFLFYFFFGQKYKLKRAS